MTPESEESLLAYISRWAALEMTDNAAEMPEIELDPNAFEVTEADRARAREGLPWWYAKPFELGDGWWEEKFEELAKVAGDKMLATCRELQMLGSLARNVDQLPDDGIDVLQQHVDRVNAAHDEYVQALIDIDRQYLSYVKSHLWVGWLVSRQIEKLAGKLPPRLFDLPSSKLKVLARGRAELDHALGKVVKRVETAYEVAVWTDRAITAIEIATGIIGGIKVIAKEVVEKGIVIAAKLAAKRAAKQVAIEGAAYIAANYVMPQVVATTGIRVDLVFSGVMVVHGIGELKKLRSARNQRLGFAETPTGSGGSIPEKKSDLAPEAKSPTPKAAEPTPISITPGSPAVSNNYRRVFFDAHPDLKGKVVVHHAIEQNVLDNYPGLFTADELHSLANLRGIPKSNNPKLHLSRIRREWNAFYRAFPNATRDEIIAKVAEIDRRFGSQFNPQR